jgi:superfamily II DNA or RNA helicase/HKD family nuclease
VAPADAVPGAYESLVTRRLTERLAASALRPTFTAVPDAAAPDVLSRHVADVVRRVLAGLKPEDRVSYVNALLRVRPDAADEEVTAVQQLVALRSTGLDAAWPRRRPVTPLSDVALLTNSRGEPNLGAELRAEMASADEVDLLCAFVRWHGIRVLEEPLRELAERGVRLRVITTTYRGATERRALDELVSRFGAQVKISYDAQTTRLHAKAWLFRRRTGFDTGYVGSSNLSKSALVDGLEWNVRIASEATPTLLRKFEATFDTYWNDAAFVAYDPQRDAGLLDRALAAEGGQGYSGGAITISGLEVLARPHQALILQALDVERLVHDRHRNLVVAATGTGKTVVAALDHRRLREQWLTEHGREPRLLFVAHRREILDQALRTYREVLADGAFGELLVGGHRPTRVQQVFASVQSLTADRLAQIDPGHFDVVVVDEFHHAHAATYRRLLDHVRPAELLGLTATPERGDGVDVRASFGGRAAYELPLWTALEADLLCPFHYFGVADGTDLAGIQYQRGAYDVDGLSRLYTGNDARTRIVLAALRDRVGDVGRMRALGFCVGVDHARYMARVFTDAGIPALAVHGDTLEVERQRAIAALRSGEVRVLFAVDLFNEGLDLPDVDTLLLLRPTQSATVFLQQLGRGLRRTPGKAVLTVLDFIGAHRAEFRFDVRYRALTGTSRTQLVRDVEHGFPYLPPGSQLVLDRVAQRIVLDNVRASLRQSREELAADVRSYATAGAAPTLGEYLAASGRELADVYRAGGSWTTVQRAAGLRTPSGGPDEAALLRRTHALVHVDDAERAEVYARLVAPDGPRYAALSGREQRLARMLFFTLWPDKGGHTSWDAGFDRLRRHPAVVTEVEQVLEGAAGRARHVARPLGPALAHLPLLSHATYRREELLAGLGWAVWGRSARGNVTGVAWCEDERVDALMVNLRKDEASFTPTTMYRDYALSPALFHWESQNATSAASPTGQRYADHAAVGSSVVLFARAAPTDEIGTTPFLCLGTAEYREHRGERPMAITWGMHRPMPPDVVQAASAASA